VLFVIDELVPKKVAVNGKKRETEFQLDKVVMFLSGEMKAAFIHREQTSRYEKV